MWVAAFAWVCLEADWTLTQLSPRAFAATRWPPSQPSFSPMRPLWANRTPLADVGHRDARNIRAGTPCSCETSKAVGDRRARRNPLPEFRGRGLVGRP